MNIRQAILINALLISVNVYASHDYGVHFYNRSPNIIKLYVAHSVSTCQDRVGQPNFYPTRVAPLILPAGTPTDTVVPATGGLSWYTCPEKNSDNKAHLSFSVERCLNEDANSCSYEGDIDLEALLWGESDDGGDDRSIKISSLAGEIGRPGEVTAISSQSDLHLAFNPATEPFGPW
jgi:hypothetical protein